MRACLFAGPASGTEIACPLKGLSNSIASPTARIEASYHRPSYHGDVLEWRLTVTRLGQSSIGFHLEAHCGGEHRMTADLTLVFVTFQRGPQPWSDALRARIAAFMEAA